MSLLDTIKKPFRKKAIKPLIETSTTMGRCPGHGEKVETRIGDKDVTATLFSRQGSRILYCRFRWNGKIIRKSTHAQTREGALDGAYCWIREIARSKPTTQPEPTRGGQLSLHFNHTQKTTQKDTL